MSRGMIFAVTDLTFYRNGLQHKILREHIFNVRINLCNCIYILHPTRPYTNLASMPLTKPEEASCPNFLASSTASLIATPAGTSSSNTIS